ncbi:MAG: PilZ domain-containing protein [Desulfobacterota bacterium]|nr:PilZ domain-containing protein [Thermodesulfobacteriota bacterium]
MGLKAGDAVRFRFIGERVEYSAKIRSADEDAIVLETKTEALPPLAAGQYLIIICADASYNAQIISADASVINLRRLRTDKQEYFRVDDFFPVVARKVDKELLDKKASMTITFSKEAIDRSPPDDTIHPKLWDLLVSLDEKLNRILDRLNLEPETVEAEPQHVNVSASGIKFTMHEKVEQGDMLEVKMLLPTTPMVSVVVYGQVVSVENLGSAGYGVAVQFVDMDAEIRDRLIQYTLNRQREIIRKQRQLE